MKSFKNIAKIVGFVIGLAVIFAAVFITVSSRKVHIAWASLVLDEHQRYLTCFELPFFVQVQKALSAHADMLTKIKQAGGQVQSKEIKCKNYDQGLMFVKGEIEIVYQTHAQRLAIEKLIGDNFFGIAYSGVKK